MDERNQRLLQPDQKGHRLPAVPAGQHELLVPYNPGRSLARAQFRAYKKSGKRRIIAALLATFVFVAIYVLANALAGKTSFLVVWWLNIVVYAYVAISVLPIYGAPTNLQIGAQGIRFHWLWPFIGLMSSPWLQWQSIRAIHLPTDGLTPGTVGDANRESMAPVLLVEPDWKSIGESQTRFWWRFYSFLLNSLFLFSRNKGKVPIYSAGVAHEADVPHIMRALKHFASDRSDPRLLDWDLRNGQSFTRLWLEDLTGRRVREDELAQLQPGEMLLDGEYTVIGQIGVGGQAVTYRADRHTDNGSQAVALKEFFLPVRGGKEIKQRALRNVEHEALLLKQLNHPQIVGFVDVFVSGARAYLATELVEGMSLRKQVQEHGQMDQVRCLRVALQLCDILTYLHGQNPPIAHRDFTPDNLLMREDLSVVLIDFNVAERLESESTHTVVGKQCYISPEQFRGSASIQCDIYSLGCVLFWLLTGSDPEPISVSHPQAAWANQEISAVFDELVAKCTALDPAKRYQNAEAVKAALLIVSQAWTTAH